MYFISENLDKDEPDNLIKNFKDFSGPASIGEPFSDSFGVKYLYKKNHLY